MVLNMSKTLLCIILTPSQLPQMNYMVLWICKLENGMMVYSVKLSELQMKNYQTFLEVPSFVGLPLMEMLMLFGLKI